MHQTGAMLLFLVPLKNLDVCTVTMGDALFSEGVYKPLVHAARLMESTETIRTLVAYVSIKNRGILVQDS